MNTAQKVAKEHGVSEKTVKRAAKYAEQVEKDPELKEAVSKGVPIKQVKKERRKKQREEKATELAQWKGEKLATAKPGLILADPPWRYDFSETDSRKVENQYPTMTVEEIIADKPEVDDDAILFLWATAPKLLEALQVMEGWGFMYVTNAVWDKEVIGMGYYFRGQHELLLVGKRGKPPVPDSDKRVSSVFREKRSEHSKKPRCVYEWIERAYPDLIKKEMYQRNQRKGWIGHGNESGE